MLGLKWSDKVTNEALYACCGIPPASLQVVNARWRLFGHTLRMDESAPARKAMAYYFVNDHAGRKGNRVTIATALSSEYKSAKGSPINNDTQYQDIVSLAQDREAWKSLVKDVTNKYSYNYDAKVQRKKELMQVAKESRSA